MTTRPSIMTGHLTFTADIPVEVLEVVPAKIKYRPWWKPGGADVTEQPALVLLRVGDSTQWVKPGEPGVLHSTHAVEVDATETSRKSLPIDQAAGGFAFGGPIRTGVPAYKLDNDAPRG